MKLFDYKFLILLALTLVVYFIFREVLDLRKKIDTLQTNIDNLSSNNLLEKDDNENKLLETKIASGNKFQIPLPKKPVEENKVQPVQEVKSDKIPELIHNKLSTIDESQNVSESESIADSNNEERLAIYSNDNHEEDVEEEFSLDETSEINTDEIINNLSNNESSHHSEDLSSKKKNLLVEIEGTDVKQDNEPIIDDTKYTINSLMKLKLNELQCLAEEYSIQINSSKGRKKTKTELSNDLIQHFESA